MKMNEIEKVVWNCTFCLCHDTKINQWQFSLEQFCVFSRAHCSDEIDFSQSLSGLFVYFTNNNSSSHREKIIKCYQVRRDLTYTI